jgi:cytochrome P450
MHRDPRFFPCPEQFDPGRWFEESIQRLPRFAYFPFGGEPRYCVATSFAMMEATLLLATIAQRFRLRMVPRHPVVRAKHHSAAKVRHQDESTSSSGLAFLAIFAAFLPGFWGVQSF